MNGKTSGRNSNIELLRVISMLMIVAYHYVIFGFYAEDLIYSSNKFFADFFGMFGKVGTDIFVLISGYYMINSQFALKKLLKFAGQVWFYSIGAMVIFVAVIGSSVVNMNTLKLAFMPLLNSHYWFATYYALLMLISPFLNVLIHNLSQHQHGLLCVFLFMVCAFVPEFLNISFASGSLPLFVALYVCAAYCRLNINHTESVAKRCSWLAIGLILFCMAIIFAMDYMAQLSGNTRWLENSTNFMGAYSPFAFAIAVLLLLAFCCRAPKSNKYTSLLGGLMFGVYLCHDNQLIKNVTWQDLFHTSGYSNSPWMCVHALVTVALIFVGCCVIELLRQLLFEPIWMYAVNKIAPTIEDLLSKLSCKFLSFVHIIVSDNKKTPS